jgi:hypothetical protein
VTQKLEGPILPYLDARSCSSCAFSEKPIRFPRCQACKGKDNWKPTSVTLFWWELKSMDDYSHTIPTGTTIGKVWRRHEPYRTTDEEAKWYVGLYAESDKPDYVDIIWMPVVLRSGPAPRNYTPPEWDCFSKWQRDHARENKKS